jgi:hypothetical protein
VGVRHTEGVGLPRRHRDTEDTGGLRSIGLFSGCGCVLGVFVAVLMGCSRTSERPRLGSGAGNDSVSVHAEFEYLPEKTRMQVSMYPESTVVVRTDSSDSVLSATRRANVDSVRARFDSVRTRFAQVKPGEYRKEQVLDGTRIWVRHRGLEVFCDNCLHDFVLEAAGVAVPAHSGTELKLRALISAVSDLAVAIEGKPPVPKRILELVVDKKAMKDTSRSYELGPGSAATPAQNK